MSNTMKAIVRALERKHRRTRRARLCDSNLNAGRAFLVIHRDGLFADVPASLSSRAMRGRRYPGSSASTGSDSGNVFARASSNALFFPLPGRLATGSSKTRLDEASNSFGTSITRRAAVPTIQIFVKQQAASRRCLASLTRRCGAERTAALAEPKFSRILLQIPRLRSSSAQGVSIGFQN